MKKFLITTNVFVLMSMCVLVSCNKATPDKCSNVSVLVTAVVTNTTSGGSNGSITATATSGAGFYKLDNGVFQTTGNFTNLAAGKYVVTAKTNDNCQGSGSFVVN